MKATIATATLIISLLGARLTAAEPTAATLSVEQQFQQADLQLAIEQYKKLRTAAFDLTLTLQNETVVSGDYRKQLEAMHAQFQQRAEELRATTIKTAVAAIPIAR